MRRIVGYMIVLGLAVGSAFVLAPGAAAAQQERVSASEAWVKLPAPDETVAAAFVAVSNPTMYDVYLISATTDVAKKVEFRESADDAVKELTVPAYGGLGMDPDGVHMLLIDLERPLTEGEQISITLGTDGDPITVSAEVRKE